MKTFIDSYMFIDERVTAGYTLGYVTIYRTCTVYIYALEKSIKL